MRIRTACSAENNENQSHCIETDLLDKIRSTIGKEDVDDSGNEAEGFNKEDTFISRVEKFSFSFFLDDLRIWKANFMSNLLNDIHGGNWLRWDEEKIKNNLEMIYLFLEEKGIKGGK